MINLSHSRTYLHHIRDSQGSASLWDYLRYDDHGDLWINSLRVRDAVGVYGTPLEIHDMTIMKRRSDFWKQTVAKVAQEVSYPGSFQYYYASKANMSLSYVVSAYQNGWMAETSSAQDLIHVQQLVDQGLIDRTVQILCNGFKFPVTNSSHQAVFQSVVALHPTDSHGLHLTLTYAQMILALHSAGYSIVPILDSGESEYFLSYVRTGKMDVGLRLKFGIVTDDEHLIRGVSRHGMPWSELHECAEKIAASENLNLTMLHVMVSAAQVVDIDEMVRSLLFGAEKFFELKKQYPTLRLLNIGGGVPPVSTGYNYELFLHRVLSGILLLSRKYSIDVPDIVFEFGSYLAEECGFYVHTVLQTKNNSLDTDEGMLHWAIVDGGLMAELPDMFITHKQFQVFAGNNAHQKASEFVLGDLSCDSDGRYPLKGSVPQKVVLPHGDDQIIVIAGVGSYQRMLGGAGGAHHCGILNPGQLYIESVDGVVRSRYIPPQTGEQYASLLGYGGAY